MGAADASERLLVNGIRSLNGTPTAFGNGSPPITPFDDRMCRFLKFTTALPSEYEENIKSQSVHSLCLASDYKAKGPSIVRSLKPTNDGPPIPEITHHARCDLRNAPVAPFQTTGCRGCFYVTDTGRLVRPQSRYGGAIGLSPPRGDAITRRGSEFMRPPSS
jgi:hypothetical protein